MSIGPLSGLSGYDFSGIVERLVDVYSQPKYTMLNQQSKLQTQQNAWREVNTRLSSLDSKITALKKNDIWTATTGTSNNESLLKVSTGENATQGIFNVVIKQSAQAQTVVSSVQALSSSTDAAISADGEFEITVDGTSKSITVTAGDSLQTVATKINNANTGVKASVIQVNGGYQLAMTNSKTGLQFAASFTDVSGGVLQNLGILDGTGNLKDATSDPALVSQGGISLKAKDAILTVNGIPNITSASNNVTTAIPGVTLNINGQDPATVVTVNITADNSVAQTAVQEFVNEYNSVMNLISTKLSYNQDTKKSGDLFGDPILQGIQSRLRGMLGGTFSNPTPPYTILSDIGISTSDDNYGKDGTLTFDVDDFKKALEENPQSVANLFGAPYGGVTPTNDITDKTLDPDLHQGLGNYLHSYLDPMIKYGGTIETTQNSLGDRIKDVKDRISDIEDRIEAYRERTRLKFAALESTLSDLNSQNSWLMGQINALSSQSNNK